MSKEAMIEGCNIPYCKTIFCEYSTGKKDGSGYFIFIGTTLYNDTPQGHCYQHPAYEIHRIQITKWQLHNFEETKKPPTT